MQRSNTRPERGASSAEYGLLAALIAAVIVLAVFALGTLTNDLFTDTCDAYSSQAPDASTACP